MPITERPTPEVTPATAELIADLDLLPKSFTETGVIERLVAQLIEKDLALTVARAELVTRDAVTLSGPTNDVTARLAARGWVAQTGEAHLALNKLVLLLALKLVDTKTSIDSLDSVDEIIDAFIAANPPRA
jgi:hypothetical protein